MPPRTRGLIHVPDEYRELIGDLRNELKRKRDADSTLVSTPAIVPEVSAGNDVPPLSTWVESESESESESDSDDDWENVNLVNVETSDTSVSNNDTVTISMERPEPAKKKRTVKSLSKDEKQLRMNVHKLHVICLLNLVHVRSLWCNDAQTQSMYRKVLPLSVLQELHPPRHLSAILKTKKFLEGLWHSLGPWSARFSIKNGGSHMISWSDIYNPDRVIRPALSLAAFRKSLISFKGSSDMYAFGYCVLLRSIGVEARLVHSLQPLDFTSQAPLVGSFEEFVHGLEKTKPSEKSKAPSVPVFWVEALDRASKRWVTVDPLTKTVEFTTRSKSKLEPTLSNASNSMRYVIGADSKGRLVDVTRRYALFYNAKTIKKRVDQDWIDRALEPYGGQLDPIDSAELDKKSAAEPIPSSLQDFRHHPLFALETQLRQDEVLLSKETCGKLALNGSRSISIYRRSNVARLKSARKWYQNGRILKPGVKPLKYIKSRAVATIDFSEDNSTTEPEMEALYSVDQTELFRPPPVENGEIPKNVYGNIDLYTPSMIPPGSVYLRHPNIWRAAKTLEIDFADAVTGFDYKNRRVSPRKEGIVVASEYEEAVMEVYNAMLHQMEQEKLWEREYNALARWRKYIIALRIKERLNRSYGHVDLPNDQATKPEQDDSADSDFGGGGFEIDESGSEAGGFEAGGFDVGSRSEEPPKSPSPATAIKYHESTTTSETVPSSDYQDSYDIFTTEGIQHLGRKLVIVLHSILQKPKKQSQLIELNIWDTEINPDMHTKSPTPVAIDDMPTDLKDSTEDKQTFSVGTADEEEFMASSMSESELFGESD